MRKFSVSEVANAYMELYGQAADKSAKALQDRKSVGRERVF